MGEMVGLVVNRVNLLTLSGQLVNLPEALHADGGFKVHIQNPTANQDTNLLSIGGVTLTPRDWSADLLKLQNLDVSLSSRLNTLGQKTKAQSAPVVIASDQVISTLITNPDPINVDIGDASVEIAGDVFVTFESLEIIAPQFATTFGSNEFRETQYYLIKDYATVGISVLTDQSSAANGAKVVFSRDGTDAGIVRIATATIPGTTTGVYFAVDREASYVKFQYTNGPVAQTSLIVDIIASFQAMSGGQVPLGATLTDLNTGTISNSNMRGRQVTGVWTPILVSSSGRPSVDVNSSVLPTGAATEATLDALRDNVGEAVASPAPDTLLDRLKRARSSKTYQGTLIAAGTVTDLDAIDCTEMSVLDIHIQGTTFPTTVVADIQVQGTNHPAAAIGDGASANGWAALTVVSATSGAKVTTIKNPGRYLLLNPPAKVRVRATTYTSGTAQIDILAKPVPQHSPERYITDKDGIASLAMTAFGTAKFASPLWQLGSAFDGTTLNVQEWSKTETNGGTVTIGGGEVRLRTGTNPDGAARVRTRKYMEFLGDIENEAFYVARFGDTGVAGCKKRIGVFDEQNGFFIEQYHDGTSGKLRAITRKSGVDTVDALFPIGIATPAHNTSYQFWRFVYTPSFILVYQGSNLVHLFVSGTTGLNPLFAVFDLPLTLEILNEGGATVDSSLYAQSGSGSRLGAEDSRELIVSEIIRTRTPLPGIASAPANVWESPWEDCQQFPIVGVAAYANPRNAAGSIEFWFTENPDDTNALIGPVYIPVDDWNMFLPARLVNLGPYVKVRITNESAIDMTELRAHLLHFRQDPGPVTRFPTQILGPNEPVSITRSLIEASPQGQRGILGADRGVFGSAVMSSRSNQLEADFSKTIAENRITSTVTGGGSTAQANGQATLTTGTATTSSARLQTIGNVFYSPGNEVFSVFTARFTTPTHANSHQRAGLFDDNNGIFIGYQGTTFGFTVRSGGVDTFTPLTQANGDPLNATGLSRFARGNRLEAFDPTKVNIWRIRFGWLGSSVIHYEIQSPDGLWMLVHTVRQPNSSTSPHIQTPHLPFRIEAVKSGADATSLVIGTGSWAAGTTESPTLSDFAKLLARQVSNTDEMKLDVEPTNSDYYIGIVPDGTADGTATHKVVRIYLSATKNPTRMRFRQGVAWSSRTAGWS